MRNARATRRRRRGRSLPSSVRILAMGDFGDERCGVGSSLAAMARRHGTPTIIDTASHGVRRFLQEARAAARTGGICVVEYPTRSTVYQASLPLRAVALWALFGRSRLRVHLHEYRNLRRMLRWPVTASLVLVHRVVVSSPREQAAVSAALHGRIGQWCEIVVAPPTNGSAPSGADLSGLPTADAGRGGRTVGLFGMRRDDKAVDWLFAVLDSLPPDFDRLVLAGAGWEEQPWPPHLSDRFEITPLGHVAASALGTVLGTWDLALAPFDNPAHDGRMSLRTTLAFGVPTITVGPPDEDLTLRPPHVGFVPPSDVAKAVAAVLAADRSEGARQVAAFEHAAADRLEEALFGPRCGGRTTS
jgi:hypothetical protein